MEGRPPGDRLGLRRGLAGPALGRDVPLVDLPAHLGAVDIWNRYHDPALGYTKYYTLHIAPAPYLLAYGFIHIASFIVPIRIAAKLFIALTILGLPLALGAWIRAHRGPTVLALAGFPIAWSVNQTWGFLAFTSGTAILLYAYALLARFADAQPAPSRGLWAANAAMGPLLLTAHPLLILFWFPALFIYLRKRLFALALALPSLVLLAVSLGGGAPRIHIDGIWRSLRENLANLFFTQVIGLLDWRGWSLAALAFGLLLALVLAERRLAAADHRPLAIFWMLVGIYLVLPLHLYHPVVFAGMNVRVEVVVALAAFALVDNRALGPWREALVALPLVAVAMLLPLTLATRYAEFGAKERDFYTLVDKLPNDPALIVLVHDPWEPSLGTPVWAKFAAYARLERGGFDTTLWGESTGIGTLAFPAGYRPGAGRPMPQPDAPKKFNYDKDGNAYEYFLTRSEPRNLFEGRAELRLAAESGAWRLWQRR